MRAARTALAIAISGAALVALGDPAHAATHVVPTGGSIQAAVTAAKPGDTILIAPGTYNEGVVVKKETKNTRAGITIAALDPAHPPTIVGKPNTSRDGIKVERVDGLTVRDLRITGAYDGVRLNDATNARLENLFLGNNVLGVQLSGGQGHTVANVDIDGTRGEQGVLIENTEDVVVADSEIYNAKREGIRAQNAERWTFSGNLIDAYTPTRPPDQSANSAYGIYVMSSPNGRVENNTVLEHGSDGIRITNVDPLVFAGNTATANKGVGFRIEGSIPFETVAQVTGAGNVASGNLKNPQIIVKR